MVPPLKAHMTSVLAVSKYFGAAKPLFLRLDVHFGRNRRIAAVHRFTRVAGDGILFQFLAKRLEFLAEPPPDTVFDLSFHHRPPLNKYPG